MKEKNIRKELLRDINRASDVYEKQIAISNYASFLNAMRLNKEIK